MNQLLIFCVIILAVVAAEWWLSRPPRCPYCKARRPMALLYTANLMCTLCHRLYLEEDDV